MSFSNFSNKIFETWCEAQRHIENYARPIANWLLTHSPEECESAIFLPADAVEGTLEKFCRAMSVLPSEAAPEIKKLMPDLLRAYGCLRRLEQEYRSDAKSFTGKHPPCVKYPGGSRILLHPTKKAILHAIPEGDRFEEEGKIGLEGVLGLEYCWVWLSDSDTLDWSWLPEMDVVDGDCLRISLSPFATYADMDWEVCEHEPKGGDGRLPIRCLLAKDQASMWADCLEPILQAAYDNYTDILVFPELVLDAESLNTVSQWLRSNNIREPRIRLVVAGSGHLSEGAGYRNRCTVLRFAGSVCWTQDKRTPFTLGASGVRELKVDHEGPCGFEPTIFGTEVAVRESRVGRIMTPICLDYINDKLWSELAGELYLVPAMSGGLARFETQAKVLGGKHGAASFVCNAATEGRHRYVSYLPMKKQNVAEQSPRNDLFTFVVKFIV